MTKRPSLQLSQSQWEHLILEQAKSDETVKQFCKSKNLNVSTFYSWRSKIDSNNSDHKTINQSSSPMFVELESTSEATTLKHSRSWDFEIQIGQHIVLRMNH